MNAMSKEITNTGNTILSGVEGRGIGGKHNFNSGPSVLPQEVFEEASRAILDFNGTGLSILEIGHRTKTFQAVMDEAVATLKELMNLDSDHEVLFLHGG